MRATSTRTHHPTDDACARSLPGSVAERQLLESFSRMLPELLRFSSSHHLLALIPEAQQAHHRVTAARASTSQPAPPHTRKRTVKTTPAGKQRGKVKLIQEEEVAVQEEDANEGLWDDWAEAASPKNVPYDDFELDLKAYGM